MHDSIEQPASTHADVREPAQARPVRAGMSTTKIVILATLSYPLAWLAAFLIAVVFPRPFATPQGYGALAGIVIAVVFGVAYYKCAHCRELNRFKALMIANGFSLIFAQHVLAIAYKIYDAQTSYASALYGPGMAVLVVAMVTLAPAFLIGTGFGFLSVPRERGVNQTILTVAASIAITIGIAAVLVLLYLLLHN